MVVKSLKPLLILFSKTVLFSSIRSGLLYWYHFLVSALIPYIGTTFLYLYQSLVSVLFSCICTDPRYRYHFPVLWYSIVISTVLITWRAITCYVDHLTSIMLTPVWYYLTSDMTYLTYNYHYMGMMTWHLDISWYILVQTVLIILLTCSCSFS